MSLLGRLFGSSGATKEIIQTIRSGVDELHYSGEEKAQDKARDTSEARSVFLEWIKSTTGSRLARRIIALIVTIVWAAELIAIKVLGICAVWSTENAEKYQESVKVLSLQESATGAMMLVLGFYFCAPHLGQIADTAMRKFSGKNKF